MNNKAIVAWLALGLIWGTNFVLIKWSTEVASPMQVAFVRVFVGFLTVGSYALLTKQLYFNQLRHSFHFCVMAVLAAALYFYGFAEGTALLESGLAGAVSASIPIFSLIAAIIFLSDEKLTLNRASGLLIGLVGVVLIANPFDEETGESILLGVMWMILGSMSLGVSFVYARKFLVPLKLPAVALTTYQLGFASLILFGVTDKTGLAALNNDIASLSVLVVGLGIVGTGLAYVLYYFVVEKLGAVRASALTYVPPVVALFLGSALLEEPIEFIDYLATGIIFSGVLLISKQNKR